MGNPRNGTLTAPPRAGSALARNGFIGLPGPTRRIYDLVSGVYPLSTLLFHEVATGSGEMFGRLVKLNPGGLNCGVDLSPNMAARTQRLARRHLPKTKAH